MQAHTLKRRAKYRFGECFNVSRPGRWRETNPCASEFNHRGNGVGQKGRQNELWRSFDGLAQLPGRERCKPAVEFGETETGLASRAISDGILKLTGGHRKHATQHVGRHVHVGSRCGTLDRTLLSDREADLQLGSFRILGHFSECMEIFPDCQYMCIDTIIGPPTAVTAHGNKRLPPLPRLHTIDGSLVRNAL